MKLLGLQKWQFYILQLMSDHRIQFFLTFFLLGSLFSLSPLPPYPVYISSTLSFSHIPTLSSSHWQFTLITVYEYISILMVS